ncbi:MAG TPA: PAS domain S-box protein [Thermoanaerobaculia bacterium]|nr:PAS domain S-box protein [Thermoanaerobaculia bacterium]
MQDTKHHAIIDALPADIALLDAQGMIVSVNRTWRQFADANAMQDPARGVGSNYLRICDEAAGEDSPEAGPAAAGIRSVLDGTIESFSLEYPCHSPNERRWFLLTVTPLGDGDPTGAVVMHLDITERRRAEASLQESEGRYRALADGSPESIVVSQGGRIVFVNPSAVAMFGATAEHQLIGRSILDHVDSDSLRDARERAEDNSAHRGVLPMIEKKFIRLDGTIINVEVQGQEITYNGAAAAFRSLRDITTRKRTENELRASIENFHQLADNIVDAFWIRSADMRKLHYVSPAFEKIWGRPVATLYGNPQKWADFIVDEDRERVRASFSGLTRDMPTIDEEYRITRPDGEIRWVRSRGVQVRDSEGRHDRNIGIVTDTTDRKRSEMAVRQSQKRLREIFDGLGPSMFVGLLTPEGILIEVNRAPLDAAGLTAEDVLGKHLADTPWWTHSTETQLQLRAAIVRAAGGEASRYDVRAQAGPGNLIDLDFSIEPLRDDSGKVVFLIPSASVITERKVAEDALRQAQKMEAVGQLAAGVAHEFNNLMQALMSMSAIIRLHAGDAKVTRIGTEMEFLLKRGAGLTRQLLLFSRHTPIEKRDLDVGDEVRKASVLLRHLMPETISTVVEVSPEPLFIAGDDGQIQQVLLNLAINARDAMPMGGTLTLRAGRNGNEVFQEVEDTGHGIDAETYGQLFEPFFTTKEQGKGTGLGLAVAQGIVERHGGRFEVTSTPGQGSCFRVILPALMRETERPLDTVAGQKVASGGGRLLLVEDDASVRAGLEALLGMIGYEVISAGSAEEAIALTLDPPPALLLSDITLPGISGPELVGHMLARWPALKVVLMSGYLDESMQINARRDQWRFLQKPFEFDDLEREVHEAMDDEPAIASTG